MKPSLAILCVSAGPGRKLLFRGSRCSTLHIWLEWYMRNARKQKKKSTCVGFEFLSFPRGQLRVKQSLQRTGRQWLHSNLWGGSVTVLFLAPRSRVSVSCGSYQLPGLMIGPWLFLPPVPAAVFQFSCPTDVTVASCGGGALISNGMMDRTVDTHRRTHTYARISPLLCFCSTLCIPAFVQL